MDILEKYPFIREIVEKLEDKDNQIQARDQMVSQLVTQLNELKKEFREEEDETLLADRPPVVKRKTGNE